MATHIFNTRWSRVSYEGELVRETEKMLFYKTLSGRETRTPRAGMTIVETDDWRAAAKRYDEAHAAMAQEVAEARRALSNAEKRQRETALVALLGETR